MSAVELAGPFGPLHHIGIVARDLDAVVANIGKLLEGQILDQGEDGPLGASWVLIEVPGSPIIEVVTSTGPGPIADYLKRHGTGLHHLSFQPASFEDSLGHAQTCGFGILGENRDHAGVEEFFIDPNATGGALFHSFSELAGN